jgi:hypothetical protein
MGQKTFKEFFVDGIAEAANNSVKLKLVAPGYYVSSVKTKLDGKIVDAKAEIVKIEGKPNWKIRLTSDDKDFLDGSEEWFRTKSDAVPGLKDILNIGFKNYSGYGIVIAE